MKVKWNWPLTVAVVVLMLALGFMNGVVVSKGTSVTPLNLSTANTATTSSNLTPSDWLQSGTNWLIASTVGGGPAGLQVCDFFALSAFGQFGPGCGYAVANAAWEAFAGQVALNSSRNIMTLFNNALNITAGSVANLNATMQELLSYFEGRAEAIVPFFIGLPWNETTRDQIMTYSGLTAAIAGMELAFATQLYQDWNGTRISWNNIFGPGATFDASEYGLEFNTTGYSAPANQTGGYFVVNNQQFNISNPYELWTGATSTGFPDPTFFNLEPGGTIVCANIVSTTETCPQFTVTDFTQNFTFTVPYINRTNWLNQTSVPIEATIHNIQPFDLLKLNCVANCSYPLKDVEVSNGFAFRNITTANPDILQSGNPVPDSMIYQLQLLSSGGAQPGAWVPSLFYSICVADRTTSACVSPKVSQEGMALALGSGPSAVAGGNNTMTRYASTMQALMNNTMNTAEVYYETLRAASDNGTYGIPATCTVPYPSQGFPTSVQPADYSLSLQDGLATYWSYLIAVGSATPFGNSTVSGFYLCNNPQLAVGFNWTGSWKLNLNITASFYFAGMVNGTIVPVYPNGTADPIETYSNPSTWPVKNVDPVLLFPYEYQGELPVGTAANDIFPISVNNPMAAVLVNYTDNLEYGTSFFQPNWGVPTYLQLNGAGNLTYDNGTVSNYSSGRSVTLGDAIQVTSCTLANVPVNPCVLHVVYFDHFAYGHVSGLLGFGQLPAGNSGGPSGPPSGTTCGFDKLNQFYDSWIGDIGVAIAGGFAYVGDAASHVPLMGGALQAGIDGVGCFFAWIVVILILILIAYIVFRIILAIWDHYR